MLRKLGLLFAALALFSFAGGHWAVLQSVAWVGMLSDYAQKTGSVALAVEQTFDGAHPCELCLQVAAAKRQEAGAQGDRQKPASGRKLVKAEKDGKTLPPTARLAFRGMIVTGTRWDASTPLAGPSREDQPPTPPPRSGASAA